VHLARAEATAAVALKGKAIGTHGGDRKSDQANNSENVSLNHGNSAAYRTAKLAKYPEIVERMKAGESDRSSL